MKPTLTSRPTPALFGATVDLNTTSRELTELLDEVDTLLTRLTDAESTWSRWLIGVAPEHRSSARNMVHYWAIRQFDLRELQATLASYGLSSLGRSEPHVRPRCFG